MGAALLNSGGSREAGERQCKLSVANLVVALKQVGRSGAASAPSPPSPGVMLSCRIAGRRGAPRPPRSGSASIRVDACGGSAALVIDDWQRHGGAASLLAELSTRAVADGIERSRAIVSSENGPAVTALRRLGAVPRTRDGELHFLFPLRAPSHLFDEAPRTMVPDIGFPRARNTSVRVAESGFANLTRVQRFRIAHGPEPSIASCGVCGDDPASGRGALSGARAPQNSTGPLQRYRLSLSALDASVSSTEPHTPARTSCERAGRSRAGTCFALAGAGATGCGSGALGARPGGGAPVLRS
jgi:hypothetical protein